MRLILSLSTSVLALVCCGAVQAQTTSTGSSSNSASSGGVEEVVVTAERRVVDLQKTNLAATVLSGQDTGQQRHHAVDDLQFIAPDVTVDNFGQGIDFDIRGIGKGEHNSQTTPGVDHLSRRRGDLPRLLHGRTVLRYRQRPSVARPARHIRGSERHRRRSLRHHDQSRPSAAAMTVMSRRRSATTSDFGCRVRSTSRSATTWPHASRSLAKRATASTASPIRCPAENTRATRAMRIGAPGASACCGSPTQAHCALENRCRLFGQRRLSSRSVYRSF